jgi:hypothetical protein
MSLLVSVALPLAVLAFGVAVLYLAMSALLRPRRPVVVVFRPAREPSIAIPYVTEVRER